MPSFFVYQNKSFFIPFCKQPHYFFKNSLQNLKSDGLHQKTGHVGRRQECLLDILLRISGHINDLRFRNQLLQLLRCRYPCSLSIPVNVHKNHVKRIKLHCIDQILWRCVGKKLKLFLHLWL